MWAGFWSSYCDQRLCASEMLNLQSSSADKPGWLVCLPSDMASWNWANWLSSKSRDYHWVLSDDEAGKHRPWGLWRHCRFYLDHDLSAFQTCKPRVCTSRCLLLWTVVSTAVCTLEDCEHIWLGGHMTYPQKWQVLVMLLLDIQGKFLYVLSISYLCKEIWTWEAILIIALKHLWFSVYSLKLFENDQNLFLVRDSGLRGMYVPPCVCPLLPGRTFKFETSFLREKGHLWVKR